MSMLLNNYDFMHSTEVVGQMISEKNVGVTFAGTQAFTAYDKKGKPTVITLPMLSENFNDEMRKYIRGFLDHESAHVLYTDGEEFSKRIDKIEKKYGKEVAQKATLLFNIAEDARIEELMKERYKGSKENLRDVLQMIVDKHISKFDETTSKEDIVNRTMIFYARYLVGADYATEFFNKRPSYLKLCQVYDKAVKNLYERMSKAKSTKELLDIIEAYLKENEDELKKMAMPSEGEESGESSSKGSGGKSRTKVKTSKSKKGSDKKDEKDDKSEGGSEEKDKDKTDKDENKKDEGDGKDKEDEEAPSKEKEDKKEGEGEDKKEDEKDGKGDEEEKDEEELDKLKSEVNIGEDFGTLVRDAIKDIIDEENGDKSDPNVYRPLTTKYDEIMPVSSQDFCVKRYLEKNFKDYTSFVEDSAQYSSVIQKQLERYMTAISVSSWEYGHRKGALYGAGLSRLITGDDRIFRKKTERKTKDVAVSLLIDLSGSMYYEKARYACMSAYIFGTALTKIGINFEILGFTTKNEPRDEYFDALQDAEDVAFNGQPSYTRSEPLYMPIFKKFGDRFTTSTAQTLSYFSQEDNVMRNNVDGECLLIAAKRLMAQPQHRKILFVFSDGRPEYATYYNRWQKKHLHFAVEQVKKAKVDLYAIGIRSNVVSNFYPHWSTIYDLEDLGKETLTQLKKFLIS